MAHNRLRTILVVALTAVASCALLLVYLREPQYQGRALSQWLSNFTGSFNENTNSPAFLEASDAIRHIGPKAVPFLLARFSHEPSPSRVRQTITTWLNMLLPAPMLVRLQQFLWDDERLLHGPQSVRGFEALGTNAACAIPQLFVLASSQTRDQVPVWATCALGAVGPQALPQLLQIITNQHAIARYQAMLRLPISGPNALAAVPALVRCINDPAPDVSYGAVQALHKMNLPPGIRVPAFITALAAQDPDIRGAAANCLAALASAAAPAGPALQALLSDQTDFVRIEATNALRRINPQLLTDSHAR